MEEQDKIKKFVEDYPDVKEQLDIVLGLHSRFMCKICPFLKFRIRDNRPVCMIAKEVKKGATKYV